MGVQDYGWTPIADGVYYQREGKFLIIKVDEGLIRVPVKAWNVTATCYLFGKDGKCKPIKAGK